MRMPDKVKRLHFPRRGLAAGLALFLCLCPTPVCAADGEPTATGGQSGTPVPAALTEVQKPEPFDCRGAILMEAATGQVLYEQNADEAMPPASVTKIMTLLLVMEAIEAGSLKWDDSVTASTRASSMGGSQIFLKEGEQMPVRDLVKSVVIASANDAALALAEAVSGSEEAFVRNMNQRAAELGMKNTVFENTNGLDDTAKNHVTSARDIAIMSRELIRHKEILTFSSTWMDTVRNGAFGLTNTNRLVRFYRGCNGLKTGSTAKAGFCVSATAERDGMTLICVIMGAANRDAQCGGGFPAGLGLCQLRTVHLPGRQSHPCARPGRHTADCRRAPCGVLLRPAACRPFIGREGHRAAGSRPGSGQSGRHGRKADLPLPGRVIGRGYDHSRCRCGQNRFRRDSAAPAGTVLPHLTRRPTSRGE